MINKITMMLVRMYCLYSRWKVRLGLSRASVKWQIYRNLESTIEATLLPPNENIDYEEVLAILRIGRLGIIDRLARKSIAQKI